MTAAARLLSPRISLWRYCVEAWLIAFIPYLGLLGFGYVVGVIDMPLELGFVGLPSSATSATEVAQLVVIAPVMETVLLILLIRLITLATNRALIVASAAGLAFGIVHGLASAVIGIGALWAFFVFSCGYMAWRNKSFLSGCAAAFFPHALGNLSLLQISWVSANAV